MKLVRELARHAVEEHPGLATTLLERLDEAETARLLEEGSVAQAAAVVERLSPHYAAAVLGRLSRERAAAVLERIPIDSAVRLVRRLDAGLQEELLGTVNRKRARSVRTVLAFREGSAGALMDPDVLALPSGIRAGDALQRVRHVAELARYNVYVVDQSQRLVGALNLRELFLAPEEAPLAELMTRDPHRVLATTDRATLLTHPGWKEVHSLPVVDEAGAFLGAIRYRVLRQLEEELAPDSTETLATSAALGQVIAEGARGLLDALSGSAEPGKGKRSDGT